MRPSIAALLAALSILGTMNAAGAGSPTGDPDRQVEINMLGYFTVAGQSFGACDKVTIWYDHSQDKRTRVAFIEDEIDGYGEMWRAAAWQAVLVAADLCGRDLSGVRIFMERNGRVDGPSAGAITTIGVLAALRGDTVRPDVAMTGTINPDGTIGPVGGVPYKISGAAAAGMKLVLVPYGSRTELDPNTKKQIDLVQHGEDLGVEVRLVGDIYTAYQLATGAQLPRAAPAASPSLSNRSYQSMRVKTDEWLVRYRDQLAKYREVPKAYQSDYTDGLIADAEELVARVDSLNAQGLAPVAYSDVSEAAYYAAFASEVARAIWVDDKRGREQARLYVERFAQTAAKIRTAKQKLMNYQPKTLGQLGPLIYGYAMLTQAIALEQIGMAIVSGKLELPMFMEIDDPDEEEIERLLEAVEYLQQAAYDCEYIDDLLDLSDDLQGRPLPKGLPIATTTEFFRRAAQANLNQYEKTVIDSKAAAAHVSFDRAQMDALVDDLDYLIVWWRTKRPHASLMTDFDESQRPYVKLGQALHTYSLSSVLLAKDYSLGLVTDDEGEVTGVRRDAALEFMLEFSEDQVRRNIQLLRDAGVDPADLICTKMCADALSRREPLDRLYALQLLWEANITARTIAYLGGFADVSAGAAPAAAAP